MSTRLLPCLCLALLLAIPPALGCGGSMRNSEQQLTEQLRAFHRSMRWGHFEEAAAFVAEAQRSEFLGRHDELGTDYQVTEYEIERVDYDRDRGKAVVVVWVQSFRLPETTVEETRFQEEWSYNEDEKRWELSDRRTVR